MPRIAALVIAAVLAAGCGGAAPPTVNGSTTPTGSQPGSSPSSGAPDSDPASALEAALQAAGAEVRTTGDFSTEPLGGKGIGLCVAGQEVSVYRYETAEERAAVASRIDPKDPSKFGTSIVEWAGNPKFWQADRLIVLYLGSDPAVESGITVILGQPFARGQGRDPGPNRHAC